MDEYDTHPLLHVQDYSILWTIPGRMSTGRAPLPEVHHESRQQRRPFQRTIRCIARTLQSRLTSTKPNMHLTCIERQQESVPFSPPLLFLRVSGTTSALRSPLSTTSLASPTPTRPSSVSARDRSIAGSESWKTSGCSSSPPRTPTAASAPPGLRPRRRRHRVRPPPALPPLATALTRAATRCLFDYGLFDLGFSFAG